MSTCVCYSGRPFKQCCAHLLKGSKKAPDPLTLMRSRFSAYSLGEVGYLIRTTAPEYRTGLKKEELKAWCDATRWRGLRILESGVEAAHPDRGYVRFEADYDYDGSAHTHREFSRFEKIDYAWYYTDGDVEAEDE